MGFTCWYPRPPGLQCVDVMSSLSGGCCSLLDLVSSEQSSTLPRADPRPLGDRACWDGRGLCESPDDGRAGESEELPFVDESLSDTVGRSRGLSGGVFDLILFLPSLW